MTQKQRSLHAACAQEIRRELAKAFRGVKFSVVARCYSGGNSVSVDWIDGPTRKEVAGITCKYQQGHFDGMSDCYNYSSADDSLPQVKYIFLLRKYSVLIQKIAFDVLKSQRDDMGDCLLLPEDYHDIAYKTGQPTAYDILTSHLSEKNLMQGYL